MNQFSFGDKKSTKAMFGLYLAAAVVGSFLLVSLVPKSGTDDLYTRVIRKAVEQTESSPVKSDLAWLLAYPFAGSNAVLRVVQEVSQTSCATNYGEAVWTNWDDYVLNQFDSIPVFAGTPNGPFKVHHQLELPEKGTLLTKTSCAGFCMECDLENYILPLLKPNVFLDSCASGTKYTVAGNKLELVSYDPHRAKKGVMLFRHPLEIVVSRFNDVAGPDKHNRVGFHDWCGTHDRNSAALFENFYTEDQRELAGKLPCHEEFYRIVMWYNQAFKMLVGNVKEELVLHFNAFDGDHADATVTKLFDFLGLEKVDGYTIPFQRAESDFYNWRNWLNAEEMYYLWAFIEATGIPKTRREFHRYFRNVSTINH
jgi:hypothetical protein